MFDDELSSFEDYNNHMREMEKQMFKIDASREGVMPLDYVDFVQIFGEPTDEDMEDLSLSYSQLYEKHTNIDFVINMYGEEWVLEFLKYNERVEKYERCLMLKYHLDEYNKVENIKIINNE